MRACALASAFPQCRLYEQGYALENVARRACRASLLKASCSGQLGAGGADHHTPTTRTGEDNNVVVDLSQSTPKGTTLGLEGKMVLPSERVEQLKEEFGMTADELITALITPASTMARPPISSFKVGAVGIGGSGALYVGCNLEFAKLPLYNSVHAEQFLLVNALHHGEESIEKLAISAAPCGHCRQFFSELDCADRIKFLFFGGSYSLGQLLPMRFKPQDLLDVGSVPLLLKPQDNRVAFTAASLAQIQEWEELGERKLVKAAGEALEECRKSYAPYSLCPAGAAIVTQEGVYAGGYIESAAYNPSMLPLQSAIIDAVIDGMPCYSEVEAAVLVEVASGAVQHRSAMAVQLNAIAPQAQLYTLTVERM